MAYSKKPKYTERALPTDKSIVFYLGGHPWKSVPLAGTVDPEGDFVPEGYTGYSFELKEPKTGRRYSTCDSPQHLLYFVGAKDPDGQRQFEVRATPADKKRLEFLNKNYVVGEHGGLRLRADVSRQEADLSLLLEG